MSSRILITGASGYIGRRMVDVARTAGFECVAAVRSPDRFDRRSGVEVRTFDLARTEGLDDLLEGVDAVIHLGAILNGGNRAAHAGEDLNVRGTRALLEAARRRGVGRFVFLSSRSAYADSPTRYGRSKWQIEQLLDGPGETAVRTGMVYGGAPRGLYGQLFRLARRFPLLPILLPGTTLYPIHVEDLCRGLLDQVRGAEPPPRLIRLAPTRTVTLGEFVRAIGRLRVGRPVRLLPIPAALILGLSRLTEALPFLPTVSRERVLGLMALRPMEASLSLPDAVPQEALRRLETALDAEGRRRRLLLEGRTLTAYVLGRRAPRGTPRRYARAVLGEDDAEPLELSGWLLRFPALLRASEPLPRPGATRFARRLAIATRIAEMTPEGASRFHAYRQRPWAVGILQLVWLIGIEALLLPLRAIAGRRRR